MILYVDSAGNPRDPRPPGAVDPWRLAVDRAQPWRDDLVALGVLAVHGMSEHRYACEARRAEESWRARCVLRSVTHH